jgi:hypothetical protein
MVNFLFLIIKNVFTLVHFFRIVYYTYRLVEEEERNKNLC